MSVRQAQYALEELEKLGLIIKESHPGKTSVYKIADQTKWKKRSYKTKLNSPLKYFNRAVVRRKKKDLQGALEDFEMSLQLYELEIQKLIKSGKQATRNQKDIDDTKKEIKKSNC